jgi:hypothetical protein
LGGEYQDGGVVKGETPLERAGTKPDNNVTNLNVALVDYARNGLI